jgi:serine/threonine protein kinase
VELYVKIHSLTPDYFAPEIYSSSGYNHKCDLYSLGAIIYFMLFKGPPKENYESVLNSSQNEYEELVYFIRGLMKKSTERISIYELVNTLGGDLKLLTFKSNDVKSSVMFTSGDKRVVQNSTFQNVHFEDMLLKEIKEIELFEKEEPEKIEKKDVELPTVIDENTIIEFSESLRKSKNPQSIFDSTPIEIIHETVRKYIYLLSYIPKEILENKDLMVDTVIYYPRVFNNLSQEIKKDKDFQLKMFKNWIPSERCRDFNDFISSLAPSYKPELEENEDILYEFSKHFIIPKSQEKRMFSIKKIVMEVLSHPLRSNYFKIVEPSLQKDRDVILQVLKSKSTTVPEIPIELQSDKELMKLLISNHPNLIKNYGSFMEDKEFFEKFVMENLNCLKEFPIEIQKEFAHKIYQKEPYFFKLCPEEMQNDKKIVLDLVSQNGLGLEFCSEEMRSDKDVVISAIKNNPKSLDFADEKLYKDRDVIMETVKRNGKMLIDIYPQHFMVDKEIVLTSMSHGNKLRYCAPDMKNDKDVVLIGIGNDPDEFKLVSEDLKKDPDVRFELLKKQPRYLKEFGLENDKNILNKLLPFTKDALFFSNLNQNEDYVLSLIEENSQYFLFANEKLKQSDEFLVKSIVRNFHSFKYFPNSNDKEIIKMFMKINIQILKYVDQSLLDDQEFALELVEMDGKCLQYLSKKLQNNLEVVSSAIENDPDCWIFASKEIQYMGDLKYKTIKKIAEGGEGLIFIVQFKNQYFAEKRIACMDLNEMNSIMNSFSNILPLKHNNIFKIVEILQEQNTVIGSTLIRVVMELYDGDLHKLIENNDLSEEIIIHFAIQIVDGLKYLHENEIIHGDLKPENIFVKTNSGSLPTLKIGDFGMNSVKKHEFYGSLLFIAPEVVTDRNISTKNDIFSLGGIIYNMMEKKEVILYLLSLEDKITFENEKYSQNLKDLVKNLLQADPEKRKNLDEISDFLKFLKSQ